MLYLIKNQNFLKIGYSSNIEERLKQYSTHNPNYELLATREGDKNFEIFLHHRFKEFRLRNEWFSYQDIIVNDFLTYQDNKFNYPKTSLINHFYTFSSFLYKIIELQSGSAYNLLIFLCSNSEYNTNTIIFTSDLRKKAMETIHCSTNVITNNLKKLENCNLIKRFSNKKIQINPVYLWKGDLSVRKSLLQSKLED